MRIPDGSVANQRSSDDLLIAKRPQAVARWLSSLRRSREDFLRRESYLYLPSSMYDTSSLRPNYSS